MNWPPSSTSRNRRSSSGTSGAYCALTSTSGIFGTARDGSRAFATHDQVRHERENACAHRVVDEAEVAVERLVTAPEAPADSRERERPDRGAEQRQEDVADERNPEDARRDRDERPGQGRDAADEDG